MLDSDNILANLKSEFGLLWKFKQRGKTLEVVTPYGTTSHKFISVFITPQGNEFVVSDGGWLASKVYESGYDLEEMAFRKIVLHYTESFDILEVGTATGPYFYKKTKNIKAIPSLVFDLATYASAIVSVADIAFSDEAETEARRRFVRSANEFLQSHIAGERLKIGGYLDASHQIKVNAIVSMPRSKVALLNYITGSNYTHFYNSITRSNFSFELAEESPESQFVIKKISIIDTESVGYRPEKVEKHLFHLEKKTNSVNVSWKNRERVLELVL